MRRAVFATLLAAVVAAATLAVPSVPPVDAATSMPEPERVLDTREGTGARRGRLGPAETLVLRLPGVATADETTVALNLTTVDASVPGYVTAWPCASPRPETSVVNFEPGRAVPNMLVLGYTDAGICLAASSAVHLVADLTAVMGGDDVVGIAPQRLLDTRDGARLRAGRAVEIDVAGSPGVPGDAQGAVVNVTVVDPVADGYAIVAPCGAGTNASTVNFRAGEVVAHLTMVALDDGALCVTASTATDVVVDSFAHLPDGDVRVLTPARLLDTRVGIGGTTGRVASGSTARLQVTGLGNVPDGAIGATVNVVAVDGLGDGYLTLWPCGTSAPLASTMNMWPGITRSNQATVALSPGGELCIRPYTANASGIHVVLDVVGYVRGPGTSEPGTTTTTIDPYTTAPSQHFPTLPPGSTLPSGSECAGRVRDAAEIRPENSDENANRGGRQYANTRPDWSGFDRVDGDFAGTTDEIIQWAACKWGIDEDIVRAQIIKESYWYMSTVGDNGESFGLGQVRVPYHSWAFEHDAVNAKNSTAYNLDYTYASWRACYEGVYTWLNTVERNGTYAAGDVWGCVGVWFSGRWYVNTDAYLSQPGDSVRWHHDNETWLTPQFVDG